MNLRDATEKDLDFIVRGLRETHIIEKWPKDNLVPKKEKQDAIIAIKNKWIRIAQESNDVLGFIWFDPEFKAMHLDRENYLWVHLVFVVDEWRSKGVGKILNKDVEQIAKKLNRNELILDVFEVNADSVKIHKKWNFKPVYTIYVKELD